MYSTFKLQEQRSAFLNTETELELVQRSCYSLAGRDFSWHPFAVRKQRLEETRIARK